MGVINSTPQQIFNPPIPSVLFSNQEISWMQIAPVLSEQAHQMFEQQKNLHKNKLIHWSGQVQMVLTTHVNLKMNPSIQNQTDVKLIFDAPIDPNQFGPLLNSQVDFIGEILEVDMTVTVRFLNVDIYSQRNLSPTQRKIVELLKQQATQQSFDKHFQSTCTNKWTKLISTIASSPSWLSFLIDSSPNTYQIYLKALSKNLIVFTLSPQKQIFVQQNQQFQITNLTSKINPKKQYEVFGQIQQNDNGVIKIAQMKICEVKTEFSNQNKVKISTEESEKLIFLQQQAANQKRNLATLLQKSVQQELNQEKLVQIEKADEDDERVELFQVERMTTQNKILNNLINKNAVLLDKDEMLFV